MRSPRLPRQVLPLPARAFNRLPAGPPVPLAFVSVLSASDLLSAFAQSLKPIISNPIRRAELACHIIMPEDVAVRHVILSAKLVHQLCCVLQRLLRGHHLAVALRVAHLNADGICISAARVLVPVRPAVICHIQGIL